MLRDFGVKGVKVQEIVSLDDEMLQFIQYVHKFLPVWFSVDKEMRCFVANQSTVLYFFSGGKKTTLRNKNKAAQMTSGSQIRLDRCIICCTYYVD